MKPLLNRPPSRRRTFEWSALERRTQRKYEACVRRGGHVPSGRFIERDYLGIPHSFEECARCAVPIRRGYAVGSWLA